MSAPVLLNVLALVAVVIVLVWYPDRVSMIPLLLSRVPKEKEKPTAATATATTAAGSEKLPEVDPNKTVVMQPRERPTGR